MRLESGPAALPAATMAGVPLGAGARGRCRMTAPPWDILAVLRRTSRCGSELSHPAKEVLSHLLLRLGIEDHNRDRAFPSQQTLSEEVDYDEKTIRKAMAELQARGFVRQRRPGWGKSNTYFPEFEALTRWALNGNPSRSNRTGIPPAQNGNPSRSRTGIPPAQNGNPSRSLNGNPSPQRENREERTDQESSEEETPSFIAPSARDDDVDLLIELLTGLEFTNPAAALKEYGVEQVAAAVRLALDTAGLENRAGFIHRQLLDGSCSPGADDLDALREGCDAAHASSSGENDAAVDARRIELMADGLDWHRAHRKAWLEVNGAKPIEATADVA